MGTVFEAVHRTTHRRVALKVMNDAFRWDPEATVRFRQEAMAVARIDHPGVVQVFDAADEDDDLLWIAMELCEGENLRDRLKRGPLGADEVADVFGQLLGALSEVHRKGIVHRDLKPENVFLVRATDPQGGPQTRVKVLDFGIAKIAEGIARTKTRGGMGTPEYMAPEQFSSAKSVDARADLYSIGVILYEALSGQLPYEADSLVELAHKIALEPPRALVCAQSVRGYEPLVMACLEKEIARRPDSADALRQRLAAVVSAHRPASVPGLSGAPTLISHGVAPQKGTVIFEGARVPKSPPRQAPPRSALKPTVVVTSLQRRRRLGRWTMVALVSIFVTGGAGALLVFREAAASNTPPPAPQPIVSDLNRSKAEVNRAHEQPRDAGSPPEPRLAAVKDPPPMLPKQSEHGPSQSQRDAHFRALCATDASACVKLATSYENVAQNLPWRMEQLLPACARGYPLACLEAALDYRKGYRFPKSHAGYASAVQAMDLYRATCRERKMLGCNEALALGGATFAALYQRVCDEGAAELCGKAAWAYHLGHGVASNKTRAIELGERACALGHTKSCYFIGDLLSGMWGPPVDASRAVTLFREACAKGVWAGCRSLGYRYSHGNGVPKDAARASLLEERAMTNWQCDDGDMPSCVRLGTMFRDGFAGIAVDDRRAVALYRDACNRKNLDGCENLGYMTEVGRGVSRFEAAAIEFYAHACRGGVTGACRRIVTSR